MQQFARIITEEFRHSGFADVVTSPALEAGGREMIDLFTDTNHHIGTTRMGDSPQSGVVDANLRLFGIHNGYICSSSVFPTSAFSNPTHTIIALAVRLAEHLAGNAAGVPIRTARANVRGTEPRAGSLSVGLSRGSAA